VLSDEEGLRLIRSLVPVSRETERRLLIYHGLLRKWQQRINLVSPKTLDHAWERHFADSAQCFVHGAPARHWIDIGSGAGFPGLIIAFLLADGPGGCVELIETNGKKCSFLAQVVRETGLTEANVDVKVHKARVEDIIMQMKVPQIITARALTSMNRLLIMTESLLSRGAVGLFPKGQDHENEIEEAKKTWSFYHVNHSSLFEIGSVITVV